MERSRAEEILLEVRELCRRPVVDRSALKAWTSESIRVCRRLRDVSNAVPEALWHYLSDADIRFRDLEYARMQEEALEAALIEFERSLRELS